MSFDRDSNSDPRSAEWGIALIDAEAPVLVRPRQLLLRSPVHFAERASIASILFRAVG